MKLAEGQIAEAKLPRGVKVKFEIEPPEGEAPVTALTIDLRRVPFDDPSTLIGQLPNLRSDGTAELAIAEGDYDQVWLKHPEYLVIPSYHMRYGKSIADATEPIRIRAGQDRFDFQLKRKVKVHGRVVDAATGKPLAGESVRGEAAGDGGDGPLAEFAEPWSFAGSGETDADGEYEVELAAGRARVSFQGQGKIASPPFAELDVAADGSTVAPDIKVSPMPKIRGVVFDAEGRPAKRAVVRFRGSLLTYATQPAATDDEGRFELEPPWVPADLRTQKQLPTQTIAAFDPYGPAWGQSAVRWDDPEGLHHVEVRLAPQGEEDLVAGIPGDLSPRQQGVVPPAERERDAAQSLVGREPPELDGISWIHAKPGTKLADFRGQYVLLMFWTTWCGPCHEDLPSIRMLEELYGDRGFTVVGVHDNSMPLAAIEADVEKERMTWPTVVDHADGRLLASYKAHGVSGYPSYLLIGPDGLVVQDDDAAGPSLRGFKIEIVRRLLMGGAEANR